MDERIKLHAKTLVHHSIEIGSGDEVVLVANEEVKELALNVCQFLGEVGAIPIPLYGGNFISGEDEILKNYLEASGSITNSSALIEMLTKADAVLHLQGYTNPYEFSQLSNKTIAMHRKSYGHILDEALFSTSYTLTQFPTAGGAQLAGMSTEEFKDFIWESTLIDWEDQRRYQSPVAKKLDSGNTVHVQNQSGTDVEFSIAGMNAVNGHGQINLPGGEVYTAPVVDSINGKINFDLPVLIDGRELQDITMEFDNGKLIHYDTDNNEDLLSKILNIDEGSDRIGEFGIGMNKQISQVTRNMALDEKMSGTVHFALGTAYEKCVGTSNVRNESAVHIDMLFDMRDNSTITVDGEPVLSDGEVIIG